MKFYGGDEVVARMIIDGEKDLTETFCIMMQRIMELEAKAESPGSGKRLMYAEAITGGCNVD